MAIVLGAAVRYDQAVRFIPQLSIAEQQRMENYYSRMNHLILIDRTVPEDNKVAALKDIAHIIYQLALLRAFKGGAQDPVINYDSYTRPEFITKKEGIALVGVGAIHLMGWPIAATVAGVAVFVENVLRRFWPR